MEIEVSKKVRAAIKAKLLELGVHVDEELPDYVMVLVANRRSRVQMEQDLNLFLGENTNRFVIWLHHVLKKLDEVTAHLPAPESKKRKSSVEEASSSKKSKPVEDKAAKEDTVQSPVKNKSIEVAISAEGSDKSQKEPKKSVSDETVTKAEKKDEPVVSPGIKDKISKKDKDKEKEKPGKKDKGKHAKKDEPPPKEQKLTKPNFKFKFKSSKKIGKSSIAEEEEDKSLKLTLLDADNDDEFISLNVNSNEFEFDELENLRQVALESQKKKSDEKTKLTEKIDNTDAEEPELNSSVPPVVVKAKSTPEKVPIVEILEKTDKSPKKSEKSERSLRLSAKSDKSDRFYKPPKRRSDEKSDRIYKSSRKSRDRSSERSEKAETRHKSSRRNEDIKLKRLKSVINIEVEPPPKKIKSQVIRKEEEYDPLKPVISTKKLAVNNLILKAVAEAQKSVTEFAILEIGKRKPSVKDRLGSFDKETYNEEDLKKIVIKVPTSPKPKERISIRVDSTEESTSDEEYEIIEEIVEEEQPKEPTNDKETVEIKETKEVREKPKPIISIESSPKVILKERPLERPLQTVKPLKLPPMATKEQPQCKYWPTCTFKEKCIYPHPKCKFGSKCTKLDCAYKHDKDVCKFFPNCHSLSCNFFHPSPCRFGNGCKDNTCQLYHPGRSATPAAPTNFHTSSFSSFNAPVLPAKHLLKWKKN